MPTSYPYYPPYPYTLSAEQTAQLVAQLDSIIQSIGSGAESVSYEGKQVTHRSLDELLRIKYDLMRQLGLLPRQSRTTLAAHHRGFQDG